MPMAEDEDNKIELGATNSTRDCGDDGICQPNLRLHVDVSPTYRLYSNDDIQFSISISNDGESSDGPIFRMQLDNNVNFKSVSLRHSDDDQSTLLCEGPPPKSNASLICEFVGATSFTTNQIIYFDVVVTPTVNIPDKPYFHFYMDIFDRDDNELDETRFDNYFESDVQIVVDVGFSMNGYASVVRLPFNSTQFLDGVVGPTNVHVYEVKNGGVKMSSIDLLIVWPYQTDDGEVIMELVEKPAHIKCEFLDYNAECEVEDRVRKPNGTIFMKKIHTHLNAVDLETRSVIEMGIKCAILKCTSAPLEAFAKILVPLKFQYMVETIVKLNKPFDLSSVGELTEYRPHFWFKNDIESQPTGPSNDESSELIVIGNSDMERIQSNLVFHNRFGVINNGQTKAENINVRLSFPRSIVRDGNPMEIIEKFSVENNTTGVVCNQEIKMEQSRWKLMDKSLARCDHQDIGASFTGIVRAEVDFILTDPNMIGGDLIEEVECETIVCHIPELEGNQNIFFGVDFWAESSTTSTVI